MSEKKGGVMPIQELRDIKVMAASIARDDGTYNAGWFVTNSVPLLIAEVEELRECVRKMAGEVGQCSCQCDDSEGVSTP